LVKVNCSFDDFNISHIQGHKRVQPVIWTSTFSVKIRLKKYITGIRRLNIPPFITLIMTELNDIPNTQKTFPRVIVINLIRFTEKKLS